MGNATKALYSKEEHLYYYINRKDYKRIKEMLTKYPQMKEASLTKDTKQTPLMRAAYNGCLDMVEFLIKEGVDVNTVSSKGQTALNYAVKKNQLQIVMTLIQNGANPNHINKHGMTSLDYAILPGFYNVALYLYEKLSKKVLKQPFEYDEIAKKNSYRYVNYKMFLQSLALSVQSDEVGNFLNKPKESLKDPVPDPRQSWGQWLKRNVEFKDAPLVERNSLPEEMQPQNRKYGKIDIFFDNWSRTQGKGRVKYNPKKSPLREVVSQMGTMHEYDPNQNRPKSQI